MNKAEAYLDGKPPETSGLHAVVSTTTSNAAAAAWDWVTALGVTIPGPVWIELQASGNHAHVRFRPDNAAGTTLTNSLHIQNNADQQRKFFVDPVKHKYIDHISQTGAGTLELHVCSQIHGRNQQ